MLRLSSAALSRMLEALQDINIGKDAPGRKRIRDYLVQELLGKGAFGSVYQVKKDTGETLFAMKELPLEALGGGSGGSGGGGGGGGDGGGGGSDGDFEEPTAAVKREVQILSTLQHPNIISYYESFKHKHNLYIDGVGGGGDAARSPQLAHREGRLHGRVPDLGHIHADLPGAALRAQGEEGGASRPDAFQHHDQRRRRGQAR